MTYADIKSIIKVTAESLLSEMGSTGPFHYGREGQHSTEAFDMPTPQIWMDPLRDTTNFSSGVISLPLTLGFFDQDVADSTAEQQAEIVDRMKALSVKFMNTLSEEEDFEELTAITSPVYRYTKAVLTGVAVQFTIKGAASIC